MQCLYVAKYQFSDNNYNFEEARRALVRFFISNTYTLILHVLENKQSKAGSHVIYHCNYPSFQNFEKYRSAKKKETFN